MRVLQNQSPLSGTCPQRQWSTGRSRKNRCSKKIPHPHQSNRGKVVSGSLLILPPLCWKLCRNCSTTPQINRVQSFLQLDTWGTDSFRNSASTPPNNSHFRFPINERTFYFVHRRKLDCNGRCSRSGSKWQRTCHLLRFQGFLESSNPIFCNQAGAFSNCPLHTPFSTLSFGSQVYHRYGSPSTSVAPQLQRPWRITSKVAREIGRLRLRGPTQTGKINWTCRWVVPHSSS